MRGTGCKKGIDNTEVLQGKREERNGVAAGRDVESGENLFLREITACLHVDGVIRGEKNLKI